MARDIEIAEYVLGECLAAGHKPGKVQFTKYLYHLDYWYWRYTGKKATNLPWKFYHYGPWCEEAEDCMSALANNFGFGWRETEPAMIQTVEIPRRSVPTLISGLVNRIIETFKDKDLNVLLEATYSQTEPMLKARRGEPLDFSTIPITRTMPEFFPAPRPSRGYRIPEKRRQIMEQLKARAPELRALAQEARRLRNSPAYQKAMEILSRDLGSDEPVPELRFTISPDVVEGLSNCG